VSPPHRLKLKWLPESLLDLARLREFIRVHNPGAAQRAGKRIRESAQKLTVHPHLGRPVLDIDRPTLRDLFIPFGQDGYWLRYAVLEDAILIVKIWHGRENRELPS
jgi:plasmid stabilization system protein ParE